MSILVHGPSKSGKSTFAATAPGLKLLCDAEAGARFLDINPIRWDPASYAPPEPDGTWDTAVVSVRDFNTVVRVLEWLRSGKHPFESVILDSISEIQQRLIDGISNREQMDQRSWGKVLRDFIGTMRDFRDLTDHPTKPLQTVVLIAMTKQAADGVYKPWLQGQSGVSIPYLFDVCAAMTAPTYSNEDGSIGKLYRMLIGHNNMYEVGERVGGRLPMYVDSPTVPELLDWVFGPAAEPAAS
jgi:hypothetical protein